MPTKISSSLRVLVSATVLLGALVALPALADTVPIPANPPASSCVNATTNGLHASATAQYQKDIAPYASSAGAQAAIQNYKTVLDDAWTAMTLPYCGYGAYGTASAVHSYQKTVARGRAAFVALIPSLKKGGASVTAALSSLDPSLQAAASAEAKAPIPAAPVKVAPATKTTTVPASAPVRAASTATVPLGLTFGMSSAGVTALQTLLAKHYGLTAAGHVTGYFGSITKGLVIKFQLEKGFISSSSDAAAGLVGPKTTAALNAL
ncbi:MAG: peptidoglycan-binding protein [Patescibacteria group bacterium]